MKKLFCIFVLLISVLFTACDIDDLEEIGDKEKGENPVICMAAASSFWGNNCDPGTCCNDTCWAFFYVCVKDGYNAAWGCEDDEPCM